VSEGWARRSTPLARAPGRSSGRRGDVALRAENGCRKAHPKALAYRDHAGGADHPRLASTMLWRVPTELRRPAENTIDERERSASLADVASIFALLKRLREARLTADSCPFANDRFAGYVAVLRGYFSAVQRWEDQCKFRSQVRRSLRSTRRRRCSPQPFAFFRDCGICRHLRPPLESTRPVSFSSSDSAKRPPALDVSSRVERTDVVADEPSFFVTPATGGCDSPSRPRQSGKGICLCFAIR